MNRRQRVLIGLLGALLPLPAFAQQLSSGWGQYVCSILPNGCTAPGVGAVGLDIYLSQHVLPALQIGFVALMLAMIFLYGASLVFGSSEENSITESKAAFAYAITGSAIVSLSGFIALTFSPWSNANGTLMQQGTVGNIFSDLYVFFKILLGIALVANIVLQAFRLITSLGSEELQGRARKRLIAGFIGVGIVLLANILITAISPDLSGNPPAIVLIVKEMSGVANFLLALLGGMAFLAFLVAGFLLLVSVDEQLKERAKTIIKTTIITLVIILLAYAIVNFFIALT